MTIATQGDTKSYSTGGETAETADLVGPFPSNTTILASAARTTAQSENFENILPGARLALVINVTVLTAGASITPKIRMRDPIVPTEFVDLITGAAIVATGRTVLRVGPGLTAAANLVVNDLVPALLNFSMAVADTKSVTYSVAACFC